MENLIKTDLNNHVAIVTLNNPPVNCWNLAMADAFESTLNQIESEPNVRVVVISGGNGNCFSAGFDVADAQNAHITTPKVRDLWIRLDQLEKPTICAINGHALGGGLELALTSHFRVMIDNPKVRVGLTELNLGIIPGWGGTQRLSRIVGRSLALEMILFSKKLDPKEALKFGLVDRIVSNENFMAEVMSMAKILAERPPIAVRWVLKAVAAGLYRGLEAGLQIEAEGSAETRKTEDRAEGFAAFMEKRKPIFKGC